MYIIIITAIIPSLPLHTVTCSLAQKGNVKLAVLHMTREEGRQQTAAQTTLRDLARLPRARNRHTTTAAAAEDAPQEEGSETE